VTNFEQVVHEGERWTGERGIISFYLNRRMLQHFERYGMKYFCMYRDTCLRGVPHEAVHESSADDESPRVPAGRSARDNKPRKRARTVDARDASLGVRYKGRPAVVWGSIKGPARSRRRW
jgi:hypothetical protein